MRDEAPNSRYSTYIAVALMAAALGIALARWGVGENTPPPSVGNEDIGAEIPPSDSDSDSDSDSESESAPATTASKPFRVEEGAVAYLVCEGLGNPRNAVACPRDEAMELQVWEVIATLPRCAPGPNSEGSADIRIDLRSGSPAEVGWRDTFGPEVQRLEQDAVMQCLQGPLARLTTSLQTPRLLVSFRFEYKSQNE